jgi:ribosomal protein S18 acetylase RimI-like enzyme
MVLAPIRHNVGDLACIYNLNEVGSRIWELIDGGTTVGQIRDKIVAEYEVTPAEAEADIIGFLNQLEQVGAVSPVLTGRALGLISPGSRWFRPLARPVWRLSRYASPQAIITLYLAPVQKMPVYRRIARSRQAGIDFREAGEEDKWKVNAWLHPGRPGPTVSPDITSTCFVAVRNGRVIGNVELVRRPAKYYPHDGYWLNSLNVRITYRGMGIGQELSKRVIARSLEEGSRELSLIVREDNHRAVGLYRKLGFQVRSIPELEKQFEQERCIHGRTMLLMSVSLS